MHVYNCTTAFTGQLLDQKRENAAVIAWRFTIPKHLIGLSIVEHRGDTKHPGGAGDARQRRPSWKPRGMRTSKVRCAGPILAPAPEAQTVLRKAGRRCAIVCKTPSIQKCRRSNMMTRK